MQLIRMEAFHIEMNWYSIIYWNETRMYRIIQRVVKILLIQLQFKPGLH